VLIARRETPLIGIEFQAADGAFVSLPQSSKWTHILHKRISDTRGKIHYPSYEITYGK
jgi:hypothetical protein